MDSSATSHICLSMQDVNQSRVLGKREVVLRVGNGASVVTLAMGTTFVSLHSGHVLVLYDYIPNVIWNIVLILRLVSHGYTFSFTCDKCLIMFDNVCVGKAVMINGLYFL